jgi:hypothetical protein
MPQMVMRGAVRLVLIGVLSHPEVLRWPKGTISAEKAFDQELNLIDGSSTVYPPTVVWRSLRAMALAGRHSHHRHKIPSI